MPSSRAVYLPVALLALTACTGVDPDSPDAAGSTPPSDSASSAPSAGSSGSSGSTSSATPSEPATTDPAVLPTGRVCGDLDLSAVERVAGGAVDVEFDLGAGETPPYGGPVLDAPTCELSAPKGTLAINFTPLQAAERSEAGARGFLEKGSRAMESLDYSCAAVQPRPHGARSAFEVRCTTANDTAIVAYHVLMGTFMASCTAFDLPASDTTLASELAATFCTSYTQSP